MSTCASCSTELGDNTKACPACGAEPNTDDAWMRVDMSFLDDIDVPGTERLEPDEEVAASADPPEEVSLFGDLELELGDDDDDDAPAAHNPRHPSGMQKASRYRPEKPAPKPDPEPQDELGNLFDMAIPHDAEELGTTVMPVPSLHQSFGAPAAPTGPGGFVDFAAENAEEDDDGATRAVNPMELARIAVDPDGTPPAPIVAEPIGEGEGEDEGEGESAPSRISVPFGLTAVEILDLSSGPVDTTAATRNERPADREMLDEAVRAAAPTKKSGGFTWLVVLLLLAGAAAAAYFAMQ